MNRLEFIKRFSLLSLSISTIPQLAADSMSRRMLENDSHGILSLPSGFSYRIISKEKQIMDDGLLVPPNADGMICFKGSKDRVILIRNHEIGHIPRLSTFFKNNPFGKNFKKYIKKNSNKFYDIKGNKTHCFGGTTTIIYNTKTEKLEKQYLSLIGTLVNCSGGPTPWDSWISCEETVQVNGSGINKKHGYNFEVTPSEKVELSKAIPIKDMGRFRHEAIAFDSQYNCIYQTEDRSDGLFYKYIPNNKTNLNNGGKLQALAFKNQRTIDTSNWNNSNINVGEKHHVKWINLNNVNSSRDDLRIRGKSKGCATFARGEGLWHRDGVTYFTATTGGKNRSGQIWKYVHKNKQGIIELIYESKDKNILNMPDNITVAPWGDILLCEDGSGKDRIVGINKNGKIYYIAKNILNNSEFAGLTFDPKGEYLFVNIYSPTMTIAIKGPWKKLGRNI